MFKEFKKIRYMPYAIENIHKKVEIIPFGTLYCSTCILQAVLTSLK